MVRGVCCEQEEPRRQHRPYWKNVRIYRGMILNIIRNIVPIRWVAVRTSALKSLVRTLTENYFFLFFVLFFPSLFLSSDFHACMCFRHVSHTAFSLDSYAVAATLTSHIQASAADVA